MEEELNVVQTKIKYRKAASLNKILQNYGRQGNLMT